MQRSGSLRVGEIASAVGVSVDTIRYYEKLNLLPRAARSPNGFRVFIPETIEQVRFIRQAQEMGFSLNGIKQLLASRNSERECQTVHDLLLKRLQELESKLEQMKRFKKVLKHQLADCEKEMEARGKACNCPALATIAKRTR